MVLSSSVSDLGSTTSDTAAILDSKPAAYAALNFGENAVKSAISRFRLKAANLQMTGSSSSLQL